VTGLLVSLALWVVAVVVAWRGHLYQRGCEATAWDQGYSARPLYDGQGRGLPQTPNPYRP
jgi:hypothetical protein